MASQSSADFTSVYFYNPSLAAAIMFTILYFIPAAVLLWQTCRRYKDWRLLCLPIGALIEVGGYICRSYSVQHAIDIVSSAPSHIFLNSLPQPAYAVSLSLIVIAPLFIAAANYVTIGRLITAVLPPDSQTILGLPCRKITKIFVICDILSFLVQASGSGIASSNNWQGNAENIGVDVLIAGLATQLVTVLVFAAILGTFTKTVFREGKAKDTAPSGWKRVHMAICISILLIAVRPSADRECVLMLADPLPVPLDRIHSWDRWLSLFPRVDLLRLRIAPHAPSSWDILHLSSWKIPS
jgi:hypothetical protein